MTIGSAMQPEAERRTGQVEPEDGDLVAALRAGEPSAPSVLLERYQGIVLSLCLRMLSHRQDAEDVVQETFVRAFRAISGFDGQRPLRPWLLGIAANRCRTALSRRKRRPTTVETMVDTADSRPGLIDPDDVAGELERALAVLRPEYRLVFSLYHEQGLPYEEIAKSVDRPVGTVKTWLHRARGELAVILAARGLDDREGAEGGRSR